MMEKSYIAPPTGKLDDLIATAKQKSLYWTFCAQQLQNLKHQLAQQVLLSENEMYTLVYQLYQMLHKTKDVCDVLYDCGIVVQTGYQKTDPWRKLTPADITNIIDWQAIEDKELQDSV